MDTDRSQKPLTSDTDGAEWQQERRNKRIRNSTDGTFSTLVTDETAHKVSKEVYADDKLVSLYDMMLSLGSVNARVQGLEHDVHALSARNLRTSC